MVPQSHAPCEVRATWDTSPHVAPLTVPALVALIRRGVPGRSLWRHRLTALLALLQPGPAPHTSIPSNPSPPELPKGPGAWGGSRALEVKQSESQPNCLHSTLNSTTKPLFICTTFSHTGCFETVCVVSFFFSFCCSLASSFSFLLLLYFLFDLYLLLALVFIMFFYCSCFDLLISWFSYCCRPSSLLSLSFFFSLLFFFI